MKKLVLLSGGMDSAACLAQTVAGIGANSVETVSFNYGSKHNDREYRAALSLCEWFEVKNTRIDLTFMGDIFKSDLLKSGGDIPEGHYADQSMKRTVVPFRNGIMLSIAAGMAESIEASAVVLSNHAGDHAIYPDCRPSFSAAMAEAIFQGTDHKVTLETPFCNVTKTDIAKIGSNHKTPFGLTYSCYKGGELHCGVCGTCNERKEAFRDSGVEDPTEYLA